MASSVKCSEIIQPFSNSVQYHYVEGKPVYREIVYRGKSRYIFLASIKIITIYILNENNTYLLTLACKIARSEYILNITSCFL